MPEPDATADAYRRYLAAVVLFHVTAAEASGLKPTEYQASSLLELDSPLSTGQLAERLALTPSAATRLVDRLIAAGIARRVEDPADRRRVLVAHTGRLPDGLADILATVKEPLEALLQRLTEEQLAGLGVYFSEAQTAYMQAARRVNDAGRP